MASKRAVFPALLRYWRGKVGMSQLDLSLAADVSARHVSFLETGRAQPSEDMVLRLATALRLPLRDRNAMLHSAGFEEAYAEPSLDGEIGAPVLHAIERMLAQQEPYPMVVMDRAYDVKRMNGAAQKLLGRFVADPSALALAANAFRFAFDPRLARPFIVDWERAARDLLSRLHLECLEHPQDVRLSALVRQLLEYPGVPEEFRHPDFSRPIEPTFTFRVRRDDLSLSFLTTLTVFNAPGSVTLDELRIESYFPLDDATDRACRGFAAEAG